MFIICRYRYRVAFFLLLFFLEDLFLDLLLLILFEVFPLPFSLPLQYTSSEHVDMANLQDALAKVKVDESSYETEKSEEC